jgi:hypothetical protein
MVDELMTTPSTPPSAFAVIFMLVTAMSDLMGPARGARRADLSLIAGARTGRGDNFTTCPVGGLIQTADAVGTSLSARGGFVNGPVPLCANRDAAPPGAAPDGSKGVHRDYV